MKALLVKQKKVMTHGLIDDGRSGGEPLLFASLFLALFTIVLVLVAGRGVRAGMGERLATDVFDFAGTALRITRRDLAGPGSDASDSDDDFVDPYFFDEGYTAGNDKILYTMACVTQAW